jgi:uncharacterized protein YfaS (alpha-2-macroglobulin family)
VATSNRQPQFHWFIPFLLFSTLSLAAIAGDIDPSGYRRIQGDAFFLLAETGFGSEEIATVRLEAPSDDWENENEVIDDELADYSGADIVIYRVPDPLAFLKSQKNLHRIRVEGRYRREEEGLANAFAYVWDTWYKKSRLAWQRVFSSEVRSQVVREAPELKQVPPHTYRTPFQQPPQFEPLTGFDKIAAFRYPIWEAKPIEPPQDTHMSGASSEFIKPHRGDVRIPLGKLQPGLYLVEAYIGAHRATTVVFVSDTVSLTKTSGHQWLVWTAHRQTGQPVAGTKLLLSDGVGVLESGSTNAQGLLLLDRKSPERSYVIGQDTAGGVFVSENFYYDSEIYAAKLYAFTDRPLYQPGDTVQVKLVGRVFEDARHSKSLTDGEVALSVIDSMGTPVTAKTFSVHSESGGQTSFDLPKGMRLAPSPSQGRFQ